VGHVGDARSQTGIGGTPAPTGRATFSPEIPLATRYNGWVLETVKPFVGRSVVEVGFGHGSVRARLDPDVRYVGLDLDAGVIEQARREDPSGVYAVADICQTDLRSLVPLPDADTVLCVNVIEHIAEDGIATTNLLDLLASGGYLVLFAPALPRLYNDLDRLAGHYRRYRKRELAALIPPNRASVVRLHYFNPIGAVGWWLNGFAQHDSLDSTRVGRQVRLFDRYAVPLSRLLDNLTRRWMGQSVLCVARRL